MSSCWYLIVEQDVAGISAAMVVMFYHCLGIHYYYRFMDLWILSGTTWVSWYQIGKTKTSLDFLEQETEWLWCQLGHMQICTSPQTDNHASTPPLGFYRLDALPATQPTVSKHWRFTWGIIQPLCENRHHPQNRKYIHIIVNSMVAGEGCRIYWLLASTGSLPASRRVWLPDFCRIPAASGL